MDKKINVWRTMCQNLGITAIIILLSASTVQCNFTVQQYAGVIESLHVAFYVKCIFLLTASEDAPMQQSLALKETHKLLSVLQVAVRHVDARHGLRGEQFLCGRNRPLCVFLSEQDAFLALRQEQLGQVPSYPRWLVFRDNPLTTTHFSSLYIPFDCEFLVADHGDHEVQMTDVYKTHSDSVLLSGHFGVWREGGGATIAKPHLYDRRRSLQGLVLKGTAVDNRPSMAVTKFENGTLVFSGFFGRIWNLLERHLNFTTEPVECRDEEFRYGKLLEDGSWTGMIGMLHQNKVDVAISGFQMIGERMVAADYLIPIVRSSLNLLLREPDNVEVDWDDFLEPFTPKLWSAIIVSVAMLGVTLSCVRSVGRRHGNEEAESMDAVGRFADSLLQVAGLFCQQGQHDLPRATSTRVVFLLTGLTSIMYLAAYAASLISFLTNQKPQLPFSSVAEFACKDTYELGLFDKESTVHLIENSSDPGMQRLYEEYLLPQDNYRRVHNKSFLHLLCTDKIAYLAIKPIVLLPLSCPVVWLPENLLIMSLSFMVPKGSPYRQILNKKLRIVWNSGVLARNIMRSWPRHKTTKTLKSLLTQVTLGQVVPMLAVVGAGVLLAASLLGFEAFRRFSRRTHQGQETMPIAVKTKRRKRFRKSLGVVAKASGFNTPPFLPRSEFP